MECRNPNYSECPKSERLVWETEQKMVRISDCLVFRRSGLNFLAEMVRISDSQSKQNRSKPVCNRFPVWRRIIENRTICLVWAFYMVPNRTSEIRTLTQKSQISPDFEQLCCVRKLDRLS